MGQINIMEIHYEPSGSEKLFILFLLVAVCIILSSCFNSSASIRIPSL
jgi:hypothetical protein